MEDIKDFRTILVQADFANQQLKADPIILSEGDVGGRIIRFELRDGGKDVQPDGLGVRLLFNPRESSPASSGGYFSMDSVENTTATWELPVPYDILIPGDITIAFDVHKDGSHVCTRKVKAVVESNVMHVGAPAAKNALREFYEAVDNVEKAKQDAAEAVSKANEAVGRLDGALNTFADDAEQVFDQFDRDADAAMQDMQTDYSGFKDGLQTDYNGFKEGLQADYSALEDGFTEEFNAAQTSRNNSFSGMMSGFNSGYTGFMTNSQNRFNTVLDSFKTDSDAALESFSNGTSHALEDFSSNSNLVLNSFYTTSKKAIEDFNDLSGNDLFVWNTQANRILDRFVSDKDAALAELDGATDDAVAAAARAEQAATDADTAAHRANTAADDLDASKLNVLVNHLDESYICQTDDAWPAPLKELHIYGKSEQFSTTGKNLLAPAGWSSEVCNGVTAINNNGVYTIKGTATNDVNFELFRGTLEPVQLVLSGRSKNAAVVARIANDDGTTSSVNTNFTPDASLKYIIRIYITSGATVNTTVYPQLEKGSTATSYEPYTGGLPSPSASYPQEVESAEVVGVTACDENLLNVENFEHYSTGAAEYIGGGSVSCTGSNDWSGSCLIYNQVFPAGDYQLEADGAHRFLTDNQTIYTDITDLNDHYQFAGLPYAFPRAATLNGPITVHADSDFKIGIVCKAGDTIVSPGVFKIPGTADVPREYVGSTTPLTHTDGSPVILRSLPNGTRDEVEWTEDGPVLVQRIGEWSVSATDTVTINTTKELTQVFVVDSDSLADFVNSSQVLCEYFTNTSGVDYEICTCYYGIVNGGWHNRMFMGIKKETASTVEEMRTWLNANNPVFYMQLKEPVRIPLKADAMPKLPATVSNVYAACENISATVDIDYQQDVNIVHARQDAEIEKLQEETAKVRPVTSTVYTQNASITISDGETVPPESISIFGGYSQVIPDARNILDLSIFPKQSSVYVLNDDSTITVTERPPSMGAWYEPFHLEAGTYTITADADINVFNCLNNGANGTIVNCKTGIGTYASSTFTMSAAGDVCFSLAAAYWTGYPLTAHVMLESGSVAHDWEAPRDSSKLMPNPDNPVTPTFTTVTGLDIGGQIVTFPEPVELRRTPEGTCDSLYIHKDVVMKFQQVYSASSKNFTFLKYGVGTTVPPDPYACVMCAGFLNPGHSIGSVSGGEKILCDIYKASTGSNLPFGNTNLEGVVSTTIATTSKTNIYLTPYNFSDMATFNAYNKEHPFTVWYPSDTTTNTQYDWVVKLPKLCSTPGASTVIKPIYKGAAPSGMQVKYTQSLPILLSSLANSSLEV